jgi:hypothetical protein
MDKGGKPTANPSDSKQCPICGEPSDCNPERHPLPPRLGTAVDRSDDLASYERTLIARRKLFVNQLIKRLYKDISVLPVMISKSFNRELLSYNILI